jgi:hypothetical protein
MFGARQTLKSRVGLNDHPSRLVNVWPGVVDDL